MPQAPRVIGQCAFILVHFRDSETTAILNEVMEIVLAKKGVKRMVLDLVGEGTYSKFFESLRVPDWILVYFKTNVQIYGHMWQAVINITKLGRTGVSVTKMFGIFLLPAGMDEHANCYVPAIVIV